MIIGIDINETTEFISEVEAGQDNPTKFVLGLLTNEQKLRLVGNAIHSDGTIDNMRLQEDAVSIAKIGLKGIKNIWDKKAGKAVDINVIDDATINMINLQVLYEIVGQILKINFDAGDLRKN